MNNCILFITTYVIALLMDLAWLRVIAKNRYFNEIGMLLKRQGTEVASNVPAALFVYAIMSFSILYFVLSTAQTYFQALLNGAVLGVVCC